MKCCEKPLLPKYLIVDFLTVIPAKIVQEYSRHVSNTCTIYMCAEKKTRKAGEEEMGKVVRDQNHLLTLIN